MNTSEFEVWGKTYNFDEKSSYWVGEQMIQDVDDGDLAIVIVPNPIDRKVYFNYSGENVEYVIYEATYSEFMNLLTLILGKDDIDSLCVGDIYYRSGMDRYMLVLDNKSKIPIMQLSGVETRLSLLRVWVGLIRSHQGYSLYAEEIFVTDGVKDWNLDHRESSLVFEGLYHYGIALYVHNLINSGAPKGFSNYLNGLPKVRLRAIAYGMTVLTKTDTLLKFGVDDRIDSIYPFNAKIRGWTPNPVEIKWQDIE